MRHPTQAFETVSQSFIALAYTHPYLHGCRKTPQRPKRNAVNRRLSWYHYLPKTGCSPDHQTDFLRDLPLQMPDNSFTGLARSIVQVMTPKYLVETQVSQP